MLKLEEHIELTDAIELHFIELLEKTIIFLLILLGLLMLGRFSLPGPGAGDGGRG